MPKAAQTTTDLTLSSFAKRMAARIGDLRDEADQAVAGLQWTIGDDLKAKIQESGFDPQTACLAIHGALIELGVTDVQASTVRTWYNVALRNPPAKRFGVSFTAAQEAGDHPDRFEWFEHPEKYVARPGRPLSKRDVRKLCGRKMDRPAGSTLGTPQERAVDLSKTVGAMSKAELDEWAATNPHLLRDLMASQARLAGAARTEHAERTPESKRQWNGIRTELSGTKQSLDCTREYNRY